MPRGDSFDGLRRDDSFAARQHRFVKSAAVVNRSAAISAGPFYPNCLSAVRPWLVAMRSGALEGRAEMHRRDSVAVCAPSIGRHPDPRVVHAERLEDSLADVLTIRTAVGADAPDNLSRHVPS